MKRILGASRGDGNSAEFCHIALKWNAKKHSSTCAFNFSIISEVYFIVDGGHQMPLSLQSLSILQRKVLVSHSQGHAVPHSYPHPRGSIFCPGAPTWWSSAQHLQCGSSANSCTQGGVWVCHKLFQTKPQNLSRASHVSWISGGRYSNGCVSL